MKLEKEETLTQLREIDEYDFEQFVAKLWEAQGWKTNVTQGAKDRGIDVIAEIDEPVSQKHLIQAKKYAEGNKVSGPDIQQYSSLRHQEGDCDAVIIVTTSSFTRQAKESADILNVKLINGEMLYDLILENNTEHIVKEYLKTSTDVSEQPTNGDLDTDARNWAEQIDQIQSNLTDKDTVHDVLSKTKNEESTWPRNMIPVSDADEIRDTVMRCINEALTSGGQSVIMWNATDAKYAIVVEFTEKDALFTGQSGIDTSIEIAKKDKLGAGVDLDIDSVSSLKNKFEYQFEEHTDGSFISVIASRHTSDEDFSISYDISAVEFLIESVTDQDLQDITQISVVDPENV